MFVGCGRCFSFIDGVRKSELFELFEVWTWEIFKIFNRIYYNIINIKFQSFPSLCFDIHLCHFAAIYSSCKILDEEKDFCLIFYCGFNISLKQIMNSQSKRVWQVIVRLLFYILLRFFFLANTCFTELWKKLYIQCW